MNYKGFGSHSVLALSTVKLGPLIPKPKKKKKRKQVLYSMELCQVIRVRILGIFFQGDREKREAALIFLYSVSML